MSDLPNILFILADDMGYGDFGCFNVGASQTPTLDHLVDDGVCLTQHYSASPVCAPARASLLTGRYPHRTGAIDTLEMRGLDRLALRERTIARLPAPRRLRHRTRRQVAQRRARRALPSQPPRLRRVRRLLRRLVALHRIGGSIATVPRPRRRTLPHRRVHRGGHRSSFSGIAASRSSCTSPTTRRTSPSNRSRPTSRRSAIPATSHSP